MIFLLADNEGDATRFAGMRQAAVGGAPFDKLRVTLGKITVTS
jgi:hypothetical protein